MSPNAALALVDDVPAAGLTVASDLLGALTVGAESVYTFPAGMYGFPECRRFALVPAGREGLFWLQSLEHATLIFLLADPFHFFPDYAVELSAGDRAELRVAEAADVAVLCVVTLPRTRGEAPTANVQGPVALNVTAQVGRQLALGAPGLDVRRPLPL
ncbi:MAG TPA: flagellar assembly protein FliW [Gemmatimonadaceae bacterium]|nr:flagellar assembly protein FliW [Gemmatimonadaceae bacterium]